jgi:hypothetical protein
MTAEKLHPRVIAGPCVTPIINGDVARVLMLPDGSGRIEIWKRGAGWVSANGLDGGAGNVAGPRQTCPHAQGAGVGFGD